MTRLERLLEFCSTKRGVWWRSAEKLVESSQMRAAACDNAANHAAARVELVFTEGLGSPLAWIGLLSQKLRPDARTTDVQNKVV